MPPRTENIVDAPIQSLLDSATCPEDCISLGQGAPFFPPPAEAVIAATNAYGKSEGYSYSEDAGWPSLRKTISSKLSHMNGMNVSPENIVVTTGGNTAFINAILATTNIGDEVIVLSPYYFNHIMGIQLAGCKPVIVPVRQEDYQPDISLISEHITPRTKCIVTISPNNPTGAVYPESTLREINKLCVEHNIYHISDEAYESFVFDGSRHFSPGSIPGGMDYTISLFSFSKTYGMPGYRIGYMVVPDHLIKDVIKVQDTISICPPGPSQAAALAALKVGESFLEPYLHTMNNIRVIFKEAIGSMEGVTMPETSGGYYFFLKLDTDKSSADIARALMEKYGVITIPGEAFGADYPALRVSYGNTTEMEAKEGLARLGKGLSELL